MKLVANWNLAVAGLESSRKNFLPKPAKVLAVPPAVASMKTFLTLLVSILRRRFYLGAAQRQHQFPDDDNTRVVIQRGQ